MPKAMTNAERLRKHRMKKKEMDPEGFRKSENDRVGAIMRRKREAEKLNLTEDERKLKREKERKRKAAYRQKKRHLIVKTSSFKTTQSYGKAVYRVKKTLKVF